MHYRPRPCLAASDDSASGRPQHRGGDSFHCCPKKVCGNCFITQTGEGRGVGRFVSSLYIGSYLT